MSDSPYVMTASPEFFANRLTFSGNGKSILTFTSDGHIKIGEGLTPDEAGRQAIDAMRSQLGIVVENAKSAGRREVIDALTALGYGNLFDGDKIRRI